MVAVVGVLAVQRLVELAVSRIHERRLRARGGRIVEADGLLGFVAVHVLLLLLLPLEWLEAPWARIGPHTAPLLIVAAASIALRYWAAWALGDFYTVRVVHVPEAPLVRRGPYAWMRHPIYRAVAVEVFALPLAFGAVGTSVLCGVGNLFVLHRRIRVEEAWMARRASSG